MKRLLNYLKCILWEGQHDYTHYPGGLAECKHCTAWKDTWL